jgi:hypothetical protein
MLADRENDIQDHSFSPVLWVLMLLSNSSQWLEIHLKMIRIQSTSRNLLNFKFSFLRVSKRIRAFS